MLWSPARKIRLMSGSTPQTWTSVMYAIAQRPLASHTCGALMTSQAQEHAVEQAVVGIEHPPPEHAG